ncbi:MAG: hypothetical protein M1530_00750 [Candidatus Marsarchaeota archaeon]|nr:hypothetical protein [Candidatus Marsarchaeota archaeon]
MKNAPLCEDGGDAPLSDALRAKVEDSNRWLFAAAILRDPQTSLEKVEDALYGLAKSVQPPLDSARNIGEFIANLEPQSADYAEKMKAAFCAMFELSIRHMQRNDTSNREKLEVVMAAMRPLKKNIAKIRRALGEYQSYSVLLGLIESGSVGNGNLREAYAEYMVIANFNRRIMEEVRSKPDLSGEKPEMVIGRLLGRNGAGMKPISMNEYTGYKFGKTR